MPRMTFGCSSLTEFHSPAARLKIPGTRPTKTAKVSQTSAKLSQTARGLQLGVSCSPAPCPTCNAPPDPLELMIPRLSFRLWFEAQPWRRCFVSVATAVASQGPDQCSRRLARPFRPHYARVASEFAGPCHRLRPLARALAPAWPNTFRMSPQPRANEPSAAASFNPGM